MLRRKKSKKSKFPATVHKPGRSLATSRPPPPRLTEGILVKTHISGVGGPFPWCGTFRGGWEIHGITRLIMFVAALLGLQSLRLVTSVYIALHQNKHRTYTAWYTATTFICMHVQIDMYRLWGLFCRVKATPTSTSYSHEQSSTVQYS